jgi:hypothetical protein
VEPPGNHELCDHVIWTGSGTNGVLGPIIGQGRERFRFFALILMGDWCDSGYNVDTATKEHSAAANRDGKRSCGNVVGVQKHVQNQRRGVPTCPEPSNG